MSNPVEQFEIKKIVDLSWNGIDLSFTNSALFSFIAVGSVIFIGFIFSLLLDSRRPSRMQALAEMFYEFVEDILNTSTHNKGANYIGFSISVFLFVLSCNIVGLMPYSFTVTSHIAVTFSLALFVLLYITFVGFWVNGRSFLNIIAPKSLPFLILLLVTPIELISYCIRVVSLSVRLFANMMAGHIVLEIFASLVVAMGAFGILPFIVLFLLIGFEFIISIVQAYIFLIMTCTYMNDALNPDH